MAQKIVWMDLEMTGLDPDKDKIIEIATILTDIQLENPIMGPHLIIHEDQDRFLQMDDWNQKQHTKSGLWQKVLDSQTNCAEAEQKTLEFLKENNTKGCYLAGNSIWQDRRFLMKHMPKIDQYLHYRMLDVSTIKILQNFWFKKTKYSKKSNHRATDDILDSIEELKFYREHILNEPKSTV